MTNEALKQKYINEYAGEQSKAYEQLFKAVDPFEEQYRKDCGNWTKPEIIDFFKSYASRSVNSLRVRLSMLKGYTDYFIISNLSKDNINHYLEISSDDLRLCINKIVDNNKFISRKEVLTICNKMENPVDQYFLLAIFEGIGSYGKFGEEIVDTMASGIKENTIVLSSGRELTVSKELIHYAKESANTDKYYKTIIKNGEVQPYSYDLEGEGTIFKSRKNNRSKLKTNSNFIAVQKYFKLKQEYGFSYLLQSDIRRSGMCEMLKELIAKYHSIENVIESKEGMNIIERFGYDYSPIYQSLFVNMYKDYLGI